LVWGRFEDDNWRKSAPRDGFSSGEKMGSGPKKEMAEGGKMKTKGGWGFNRPKGSKNPPKKKKMRE